MRRPSFPFTLAVAGTLFMAGPAAAQELAFLQAGMAEQLDATGAAARECLKTLMTYPKEVSEAALELAQQPALIVRLRYVDAGSPQAVEAVLRDYAPPAQAAARVLIQRPEVLQLMERQLVAMSVVGRLYSTQREAVNTVMNTMSQRLVQTTSAAADAWAQRLSKNATAATQLEAARQRLFGAATRAAAPTVAGYGPSQRPVAPPTSPELPDPATIEFILANADEYAELAAELVDQWELERNPEPFRVAIDRWFAHNRDILPDDFVGDPDFRKDVLKEQARFRRQLQSLMPDKVNDPAARRQLLEERAADYPTLTRVREDRILAFSRPRFTRIAGAPWTSGSGGGTGGSRSGGRFSSGSTSTAGLRSGTRNRALDSGEFAGGNQGRRTGRGSRSRRDSDASMGGFGGGQSGGGFGGRGGFGSGGFGNSGFGGGGFGGFGGSGFGGGGFGGFGGGGLGNSGFGGGGLGSFGNSGFGGFGGSSFGGSFGNSRFGNSRPNARFSR